MTDLERFIIARWMYSIGEPIMEDYEYSMLLASVKANNPDSEYIHRSWSSDPCPVELLKKYGYEYAIRDIVLSDKTESIPSINDIATLRSIYGNMNEESTLSYKHDGWNIQSAYYNGELVNIQTRGRASDAISAEALMSKVPKKISRMGMVKIAAEATVSDYNYRIVKGALNSRSQRGAVSSCLARPEFTKYIDLHAFSILTDEQVLNPFQQLEEWGFTTPKWRKVKTYEDLLKAMKEFSDGAESYGSPTDGLVLRNSMTRAIRLLHWEEPIFQTYVTGYDESYGAHRIGVKAVVCPVHMKNSTQRLVSCTNYQRIIDNNLRIGYPIAFRLSSMAIADLDEYATRLLQKEWEGREEEYRRWVDERERIVIEDSVRGCARNTSD